ncbi:MAG TPA: hypothetical protein VHU40_18075 [Polyangia bacterium]|nr:hypothetical protein [Polyangia bacterium]
MKLPADIDAQIEKQFGPAAAQVRTLFEAHDGAFPEAARVARCVLFLAKQDVARVSSLLDSARADYRDVIFWAEYTDHAADRPKHVRDFGKSFELLPPKRR